MTVYFLQAGPGGLIKIGHSAGDGSVRLSALQTGSPVRLSLAGQCSGGKADEQALHERFAHLNDHGEWFRPGDDLVAYIREHGLAPGKQGKGGMRTSVYIPGQHVERLNAVRAEGHSLTAILAAGLDALEAGEHEHAWKCSVCHVAPEPAAWEGAADQQAMAEMLAESRRRCAELEEILGSDRAAEAGDRAGEMLQARARLEEQLAAANGQIAVAASQYAELQAELAEARDAGQEQDAQAVLASAAAESELRTWRQWAAQVCAALDITEADKAVPWIRELRAAHGSPRPPEPPNRISSRPGDHALLYGAQPLAGPDTPATGPQSLSVAPGAAHSGFRPDLEDLPAEDPHMQARGFPLEAGDEMPGEDDWPSSFTDDPEGDDQ